MPSFTVRRGGTAWPRNASALRPQPVLQRRARAPAGAPGGRGLDGGDAGQPDSGPPPAPDAGPGCGALGQTCCLGPTCDPGLACYAAVCDYPHDVPVGHNCTANSDCNGGSCIPLTDGRNVCTLPCVATRYCLSGWTCAEWPGSSLRLCQCSPSVELCDGKDNDCDGTIDDSAEPRNDCIQQRGATSSCSNGECVCPMGAECGDTQCTDIKNDITNCGACDHVCTFEHATAKCSLGRCSIKACEPGFANCQNSTTGCPIDLNSDEANCGSCNHRCNTLEACSSGACVCEEGATLCGTRCRDLLTDVSNCGTCGHACAVGAVCNGGSCVCENGESDCGGVCRDLSTDVSHCGTCETACATAGVCQSGVCGCPDGLSLCGNACVDLNANVAFCGTCDTACSDAEVCSSGQCTCPATNVLCDGHCYDVANDVNHCGDCFNSCPTGATCTGGRCLQAIASQLSSPTGPMKVDSTYVYWSDHQEVGTGYIVNTVPKWGGQTYGQAWSSSSVTDYAIDDTFMYWTYSLWPSTQGHRVMRQKMEHFMAGPVTIASPTNPPGGIVAEQSGETGEVFWTESGDGTGTVKSITRNRIYFDSPVTLASGLQSPGWLVIDGTSLYWTAGPWDQPRIEKMPRAGGTVATLAELQEVPTGLLLAGDSLYWNHYDQYLPSNEILQLPLSGGTPSTFYSGAANPVFLFADTDTLYWTSDDGAVLRKPFAGSTVETLVTGLTKPSGIAVDGYSVYFTAYKNNRGVVYHLWPKDR